MKAYVLFFTLFGLLPALAVGQKWQQNTTYKGDTMVTVERYMGADGQPLEDSTGTHKIVSTFHNYYLLFSFRYDANDKASEDHRGVHHVAKFWKYFKFYDKNGAQVRRVKDAYQYTQSDATHCVYVYDEKGNLIEVSYFKEEPQYDSDNQRIGTKSTKAVAAYKGMAHRYVYKHLRKSKILKELNYSKDGRLQDRRVFKRTKVRRLRQ